jgi:hypothetical protein
VGLCEYCGQKSGWLRANHRGCEANADLAGRSLKEIVYRSTLAGRPYSIVKEEVKRRLSLDNLRMEPFREIVLQAANDAVSQIALRAPVSQADYQRLDEMLGPDGFNMHSYGEGVKSRKWFGYALLAMSSLLWQVLHNVRPVFDDPLDFNLRPNEYPIIQTGECVTYAEQRMISQHTRSFGGLSVPVGAGIYYHFGGSQGHVQRSAGLVAVDGGKVLITSAALYFGGKLRTFRIPFPNVLRYESYTDAVGVCEAHGAPKVFIFDYSGMDAGWFFYNLLAALSKRPS